MIKNCGNTQGDVDEEEDLCAVPPHIMRIMQVQNMSVLRFIFMVKAMTNVTISLNSFLNLILVFF